MEDLKWAMQVGIFQEPAWYPGLSHNSSAATWQRKDVAIFLPNFSQQTNQEVCLSLGIMKVSRQNCAPGSP